MRPIQLTMTAFGSYAETTRVPFDALENGLYLITGDTGAGKTTIFDGIVFALYGKASGKDRTPEMMHCDLVERSVDTAVELVFSQAGRRCTVTRTVHFPKKRKGDGGYGDADIQATLTGEGLVPVEGASRVSAACEALLGLNAEQFRKIVMLAQGEFRDFLKADSEKKNEILGKLFDSTPYVWYQRLLEGAAKRLEALRSQHREALKGLLAHRLALPPEADPADYLPDAPELGARLDALAAEGQARSAALEAGVSQAERGRDRLLVEKTEGKALNEALDRLAAELDKLALLNGQAAEMAGRKAALDRAETALRRVLPPLREAERTAREQSAAKEALDRLAAQALLRQADFRQAQADRADDPALAARREEIAALRGELTKQLALFAALGRAEADRAKALEDRDGCLDRQAALEQDLAEREQDRAALAEALTGLEDAELRADQARRAAEEAQRVYAGLAEAGGVRDRFEALTQRGRQLEGQEGQYRDFVRQVLEAQTRYDGLYRRFLAGQAGLLAAGLRREIETGGAGLCPVCGSRLGRAHLGHLAPLDAETPAQEAVETARAEAEGLEAKRREARETLDRAWNQLQTKMELLAGRARELRADCQSWEVLASPGWLAVAENEAWVQREDAVAALEAAMERVRRRNELREALPRAERAVADLRTRLEGARNELTEREKALGAAEQGAALLRSQLRFPNEAAARAEDRRLEAEHLRVSGLLTDHEAREKQAKEALDRVQGQLRAAGDDLTARTEAARLAREAGAAALAAAGFADEAAVTEALLPCRGMDPEIWLNRERTALTDWDHQRRTLTESTEALTRQTAGKVRADLEALGRAFDEAEADCRTRRAQLRSLTQWLDGTLQTRDQAKALLDALAATDRAWTRLSRLAALAVGSTAQGGKLSFDRYVMGTVFREILEMANLRLDRISGGRYQLQHRIEANRSNAAAGLDVEILDLATGRCRSSASLSGGEAFYTSLALALGLSDVVQQHAGGVRLEALFIDEGFGSLDDGMLDSALAVLNDLTRGDRLVGIISHVDKLGASIPQKIIVRNGPQGSGLRIVT